MRAQNKCQSTINTRCLQERCQANILIRHLSQYFGQLINAVNEHGGDVLKFAGDALICMFGDEKAEEDIQTCALRAIQCGVDIQTHLALYDSNEGGPHIDSFSRLTLIQIRFPTDTTYWNWCWNSTFSLRGWRSRTMGVSRCGRSFPSARKCSRE